MLRSINFCIENHLARIFCSIGSFLSLTIEKSGTGLIPEVFDVARFFFFTSDLEDLFIPSDFKLHNNVV